MIFLLSFTSIPIKYLSSFVFPSLIYFCVQFKNFFSSFYVNRNEIIQRYENNNNNNIIIIIILKKNQSLARGPVECRFRGSRAIYLLSVLVLCSCSSGILTRGWGFFQRHLMYLDFFGF